MSELKNRKKGGNNNPPASPSAAGGSLSTNNTTNNSPIASKLAAVVGKDEVDGKKSDVWKRIVEEGKAQSRRWEGTWSIATVVLTVLAFLTRAFRINDPAEVVFDEVHFGKFASYYLQRLYFFDVHPPFGKLLLAFTGWIIGYKGHFMFEAIGDDYVANNVPFVGLRMLPTVCGTLVVTFCFLIMKEIGLTLPAAILGALMLIFDNALIAQSRLILLDSMLLVFGVTSLYTWIKFYKERHHPWTFKWWFWLSMTGVSLACTLGVKMVGLFTIATVGVGVLVDLWRLWDINYGLTLQQFRRQFAARALCLILLPIAIYLGFFYIHFEILIYSGPGDSFMSPAFQAELQGSDVSAFTVSVPYYANISLKHKDQNVFMYSHSHRYPLRYDDGRISSEGQQVNGNPQKDEQALWTVVPVDPNYYPAVSPYTPTYEEAARGVRYLKSGDIIRLYHPATDSYLLTHDVASPLTTTNMEITTCPAEDDQAARYQDTLWRIENVEEGYHNQKVKSRRTHFRIVSVPFNVAIHAHKNSKLPAWGFGHNELNGNKNVKEKSNIWYIHDIYHERIVNGVDIDEPPQPKKQVERKLPFLAKFLELQSAMIAHNAALTAPHPYSSTPITWPFVIRGISFWETKEHLRQIYLLGNPFVWWASILGIGLYAALWVVDRIFLRRGQDTFGPSIRKWFDHAIGFLFIAWLLHWIPFFLMGRMLFLHHYLPSFIFSTMVAAALVDFIGRIVVEDPLRVAHGDESIASRLPFFVWMKSQGNLVYLAVLVGIAGLFLWSFAYFAPLTYGTGFDSVQEIRARKWFTTWDLQHA